MSNPLVVTAQGGGTTYSVFRLRAGLQKQLVASVTQSPPGADPNTFPINSVIQIGNRIIFLANGIWQKTGAAAPVEVVSVASLPGTNINRIGLFYTMLPAGPTIFGVSTGVNPARLYKYDYLTDVWSVTSTGVNLSFSTVHSSVMVLNSVAYFVSSDRIITIDPATATVVSSPVLTGYGDLTSYKGIIWALRPLAIPTINQYLGGVFSLATAIIGGANSGFTQNHYCIYEKGGIIYGMCGGAANGNGWFMTAWDPVGLVATDVTNTILAPALRAGGSLSVGSGVDTTWRVYNWKYMDGATERVFLTIFLGNANAGAVVFEHVGSSMVLVNASDWTTNLSILQNDNSGDEYYWTEGELNAVQTAQATPDTNGMKIPFYANGDAGTADSVVELWYTVDGNGKYLQATIGVPTGGTGGASVIAGNVLTVVDANGDTGSPTQYNLLHDFAADGISSSSGVRWKFVVRK